jgi:carbonic anhydrase/acetyltransferase-like protein (isoleucine patch superfamily)
MSAPAPAGSPVAVAPSTKYVHPTVAFESAKKEYTISVGHGSAVDAYVTFVARQGPIVVGEYCVIKEYVRIENNLQPDEKTGQPRTLVIGDYNTFETYCSINALKIGEGNKFGPKSSVGVMTTIGDGCILHPMTRVTHDEVVPNNTVVFGEHSTWATRQRDEQTRVAELTATKELTRWYRVPEKDKVLSAGK